MENQLSQTERLRTALYRKMSAAQAGYRDWLLSQPAEEILNHAYEYAMREDILESVQFHELSPAHTKALLALRDPLSAIYKDYQKIDPTYMEDIQYSIEYRAEREAEKRVKARKSIPYEAGR